MKIREISEAYTFQTQTSLYGGFCIERYIRERIWFRWGVSLWGRVGFILLDVDGKELFRGSRPIGRNYMVNPTLVLDQYLTEFIPIEVTIIHYLDNRKGDLVLLVKLLPVPV